MLVVLAAVAAWPLLKTIYFSVTDARLGDLSAAAFAGLRNYYEWVDYGNGEGEAFGVLWTRSGGMRCGTRCATP